MNDLAKLFSQSPREWLTDGTSIVVIAMILGRAWHAVRTGGGLVGLWRALLYGTNTPKQDEKAPPPPAAG